MQDRGNNESDDGVSLESKVLAAVSKLQKNNGAGKKARKPNEVTSQAIVDYLTANYCWLDGDIHSQVLTALLSCVKTGVICVLENGSYRLVGPVAKNMTSTCVTRALHGPKCGCLDILKLCQKKPTVCCVLKNGRVSRPKARNHARRGSRPKRKAASASSGKSSPKSKRSKRRKKASASPSFITCAQDAQQLIGTGKSELALADPVCDYCLEVHDRPSRAIRKSLRNKVVVAGQPCVKCYPAGAPTLVRFDKFSPRDETPAP